MNAETQEQLRRWLDDPTIDSSKSKAIDYIVEMDEEDIEKLLPLLEQLAGLRETVDILSNDPDVVDAIVEADQEMAAHKTNGVA